MGPPHEGFRLSRAADAVYIWHVGCDGTPAIVLGGCRCLLGARGFWAWVSLVCSTVSCKSSCGWDTTLAPLHQIKGGEMRLGCHGPKAKRQPGGAPRRSKTDFRQIYPYEAASRCPSANPSSPPPPCLATIACTQRSMASNHGGAWALGRGEGWLVGKCRHGVVVDTWYYICSSVVWHQVCHKGTE